MSDNSGYRLRYVIVAGVGLTFVLALAAYAVSPWGPWVVPIVVAAVCGAVVAEGNNGAGAGGLVAGGGGFLFAFAESMDGPATEALTLVQTLQVSLVNGINLFALFGAAGMLAGGIAGLAAAYASGRTEADESQETAE